MSPSLRAFGVACALVALSTGAMAQGRDPAAADKLFRQARELMKSGDYATACPKLVESQRLDPAPGTAINLSECFEKQGKLGEALRALRDALDSVQAGDPRVNPLKQQIATLDKRLPRLTLELAANVPKGTRVTRDDVALDDASLGKAQPVDPGDHVVVVSAPGRKDARQSLKLAEGEARSLKLEPGEPELAGAGANRPREGPEQQSKPLPPAPSGGKTLGFVVGGVGIALVGVGAYSLLHAHQLKSDSDAAPQGSERHGLYEDAKKWQTVSVVSFAAGGVAVATGAWLLFGAKSERESAHVRVTPLVGRGSTAMLLEGTW